MIETAAAIRMQAPDGRRAASGLPLLLSLPRNCGAYRPRDSENNILEHRYTLVFMLDSAALMTTKFMMPAACATPECANTLTNGLWATTLTPVAVHGTVVTMMVRASM